MSFLQAIEEDGTQENSAVVGTYFINELAKLRDEFEIIGDVRGKGLMIGVEMVSSKVSDGWDIHEVTTLIVIQVLDKKCCLLSP